MKITQENNAQRGQFVAHQEDKQSGLMTYQWDGENTMIIDHTEVNPEFSGQGIGKKLVMSAVAYARENNIKIKPVCPFAVKVFDENPDLSDLRV